MKSGFVTLVPALFYDHMTNQDGQLLRLEPPGDVGGTGRERKSFESYPSLG